MRLGFFVYLFAVSLALLVAADRCQPMPPPETILAAQMTGCSIQQQPEPDTYWYVRVWTQAPDGARWEKFYSARPPDELRKALSDCDAWLACLRKAAERLRSASP